MKTAIVYYSKHHSNTKKVLDALCKNNDITLIDATKTTNADLSGYDLIGYASGIYYSKFHKSVLNFAKKQYAYRQKNIFHFNLRCKKRRLYQCNQRNCFGKIRRNFGRIRLSRI